jgi:four helix bundle protein
MDEPDGLTEWAATIPEVMREDPMWRLPAYRYALYLGDLVQADIPKIRANDKTRCLADQLLDAVQSISANIAEGYGRTTGPERAKFFEYAQSSAREGRDWLFKVRHALDPDVSTSRILLVTRIMKILTVAINRERAERDTRARRRKREEPSHETPGAGSGDASP